MGFLVVVLGLVAVYVYRASTFQLRVNAGWGTYPPKWVVYWRHASWWAWAAWAIVALGILMLPALRRTTATGPAPIRRMSSPSWAFVLGVSVLVLAAILLVADVNRETFALRPVLVSKQLIPKGTPGSVVVKNGMWAETTLPPWEVEDGALGDLVGRTATVDILPGQQLTASDFTGPPVLVAKKFIPTGTAGSMAARKVISVPTLSPKEVEDGAITDPWYLAGRTATVDIFPGQQLTVSDFTTGERDKVFVAKQLIKKGTPGSIVAKNVMYAPLALPPKEVEDGTIPDPSCLARRTAAVDILPGQQLTVRDFKPARWLC